MAEAQLRLFPDSRPLLERFGAEFFRNIPRQPGVYVMSGDTERILYIGKAKDLRQRISSYKYPQCSRKVQRLGARVRAITWEICADGTAASVRENELLRLHKPTFNVVNTRCEHYPFIGLRVHKGEVCLRLTKFPQSLNGEGLYGAFKGLPLVRAAIAALFRLCWLAEDLKRAVSDFPSVLLTDHPPENWRLSIRWQDPLVALIEGASEYLIEMLAQLVPAEGSLFETAFRTRDVELLREFYVRGPRRNRELRELFDLQGIQIAQGEVDDLLALRGEKARCAPA